MALFVSILLPIVLPLLSPAPAFAQGAADLQPQLRQVLPGAERFSAKQGQPPVIRGFRTDPATGQEVLVGFAFLTADLPPEEIGYSGPIRVLVGMDPQGVLTGVVVLDYFESHRSTRGDFLRARGFLEQFAGKSIRDPFRPRRDLDGISGATITVTAMARGIRSAGRRVAAAHIPGFGAPPGGGTLRLGTVTAAEMDALAWPEIVDAGLVQQLTILDGERAAIDLSVAYVREPAIGEVLLGARGFAQAIEKAGEERVAGHHLMLVGADGGVAALFRPQVLRLVQGEDTLRFGTADMIPLGAPTTGKVDGQFRSLGLLLVNRSLDVQRPFTIVVDMRPGLGFDTAEFPGLSARPVDAVSVPPPPAAVGSTTTADAAVGGAGADAAGQTGGATGEADATDAPTSPDGIGGVAADPSRAPSAPPIGVDAAFDGFDDDEEETVLGRTLANTSWLRVGALLILLTLASLAFSLKRPPLRWVALAVTIGYLGFTDGGFLSVSHITAAIKVGPSVFLSDIPLLLLVVFTAITTLLWGRVFCGYLCPFGALQDVIERVVPKRFRRELPRALHRKAYLAKYVVLAALVLWAFSGSNISLYQYFEPFGTVFFFSGSLVLWGIAGAILLGVAVVPRFYCRYLCPLGAALAVVSTLSPFRIRRVEQCGICRVCEHACPTGAIVKDKVDFKECVRCNDCETKLIRKAGVCRHDMETVRPRLVQLKTAARQG